MTAWPPEVAHLPVCPHRHLPIPYIAERDADGTGHFTILDDDRATECLAGRLCAMCGLPMLGEVALLGDEASLAPGGFFIEPPVHERCAELAAGGLCPFVSRQRVPRRPLEENTAVVGSERDRLAEVGRSIPKRPWVMVVALSYRDAWAPTDTSGLVRVYLAGPLVRVRRYAWDRDGRLAELPREVPRTVLPMPRTQPRRRPRSQRRRQI